MKPRIHFKVSIRNASGFHNAFPIERLYSRNPTNHTIKECLLRKLIKKSILISCSCFNKQKWWKVKKCAFIGSVKMNMIRKSERESREMKRERNMKEAYFSRPKMKALSLILWLVSSEYWLTLENRLCKTRVEGPRTERININHFLHPHSYNNNNHHHHHHSSHTELCGGLDHTPGLVFALSNDQVQYIRFQSIMQYLTNGRTQVL